MKIYTIHLRPGALSPDRDAAVVKEGFCWPACLFGPLWALRHGMWFTAAGLSGGLILIVAALAWIRADPTTAIAVLAGLCILVGFGANDWRRSALAARGWRQEGLAAADSADGAAHRFFDRRTVS